MTLVDLFHPSVVVADLQARDKKAAIRELIRHLTEAGQLQEDATRKAEKAVHKRETVGSTGIGKGLAIPHAKECTFVDTVVGAFGRSLDGIPFESVDGGLVHLVFLVLSPPSAAEVHLNIMRRVSMLHRDDKTLRFLATDPKLATLQEIFKEVDDCFK